MRKIILAAITGATLALSTMAASQPRGNYAEIVARESITITATIDKIPQIARGHRRICDSLGQARCRVVRYDALGHSPGKPATLVLHVPGKELVALTSRIATEGTDYGFAFQDRATSRGADDHGELQNSMAELAVSRLLASALREGLASADDVQEEAINRRLRPLERQIESMERHVESLRGNQGLSQVTIHYQDPGQYRRMRSQHQIDGMLEIFWISTLAAIGLALLTSLYIGIIAISFLGLRGFARRRGWLGAPC